MQNREWLGRLTLGCLFLFVLPLLLCAMENSDNNNNIIPFAEPQVVCIVSSEKGPVKISVQYNILPEQYKNLVGYKFNEHKSNDLIEIDLQKFVNYTNFKFVLDAWQYQYIKKTFPFWKKDEDISWDAYHLLQNKDKYKKYLDSNSEETLKKGFQLLNALDFTGVPKDYIEGAASSLVERFGLKTESVDLNNIESPEHVKHYFTKWLFLLFDKKAQLQKNEQYAPVFVSELLDWHPNPVKIDKDKGLLVISQKCLGSTEGLSKIEEKKSIDYDAIQKINLSSNLIGSVLKDDFVRFGNLYELNLSNNQLSQLPEDFFEHIKFLEKLFLHKNKLIVAPKKLPPALKVLTLHDNKISAVGAITGCVLLEQISLHNNPIKSLPKDFLGDSGKIKQIAIDKNLEYKQLPDHVRHAIALINNKKEE